MRILHISESLDPKMGGPSISAPSQACAQAARGDTVTYLYYRAQSQADDTFPEHLSSSPGVKAVNFSELPSQNLIEILSCSDARRWLKKNIEKYDVIHLHGVWRPILAVAALAAARQKIPYILQPHGMLDIWSMQQKAVKKKIAWWIIWRKIFNRAAFIHTLNKDEETGVRHCGVKTTLATIGNGIFREQLEKIENLQKDISPISQPYILFMGRLHAKKGLDILAEAYRLYRQRGGRSRLRVVGPDEGALKAFIHAIEKSGVSDYVDVLPPVYGDEKYPLIRGATCFCLPSYQEGFSVALLEAAACGIPLVISKECHFPEIEENNAGFVLPLDPSSFADALLFYSEKENETERDQQGKRGREMVRQNFTWESIAEQLNHYYNEALSADNRVKSSHG